MLIVLHNVKNSVSFCSSFSLFSASLRQRTQNAESMTIFHLSLVFLFALFRKTVRKCKTKIFRNQMFLPNNPAVVVVVFVPHLVIQMREIWYGFSCSLPYNCLFILYFETTESYRRRKKWEHEDQNGEKGKKTSLDTEKKKTFSTFVFIVVIISYFWIRIFIH